MTIGSDDTPELIIIGADQSNPEGEDKAAESGSSAEDESTPTSSVEEPAKVMRIGTMVKQLLEEVREAPLDERSRVRLREIYETSVKELSEGLSPDLRDELDRLVSPFEDGVVPSDAELRIAQAQLVGWLEGLFHGIQAAMFAQQVAVRQQLEDGGRRGLPAGGGIKDDDPHSRPGTYL